MGTDKIGRIKLFEPISTLERDIRRARGEGWRAAKGY